MNCISCGSENPPDKKFCGDCGAKLPNQCPQCGSQNPGEKKFCGDCGTPLATVPARPVQPAKPGREPSAYTPKHLADRILQSRSALEGERKQVTVLFADVKGSMELAEQLDPEEWHQILERFFAILTEGVHRFEGTVNQYTGDGIMALFGAPIAHEDHAQRACYAALQLRDSIREYANTLRLRHGVPFGLRIGLNSGDVVVGSIGDDLRMDYTAQGHTVGLAQRMETLAESGHICLSENTARLIEGYFQLQDLGRTRVKGVSEEIGLYDLAGVGAMTTRLDRSRARGLSRFVGRDTEMGVLDEALAKARSGSGQVVGVVAEAGTGKSRLCAEFLDSCRVQGIPVLEGRGVAHGKAIPMLPMLQLWRALFDIAESDGPEAVRAKIAGRLLLMDEAFRESLPLLFDLFGVPDPANPSPALDPEVRQRRLHGVVKRFMNDPALGAGVRVYLLEDLHWFDGASDAFLATIIDSVPGTRHLWIVNFRPEYRAGWLQRSYYHHLSLQPLTTEAIRALLRDHLGNDPSTATLPELIHEKTRGNPFFIEEVVQSLLENGHLKGTRGDYRLTTPITALQVPPTVQALLAARIDRLGDTEKQVLQTASIIGKTFPEVLLRTVLERVSGLGEAALGAPLSKLVTSEFLFESVLYPVLEYSFKHPLTQEVAQGSQLKDRRSRVHSAVAAVLEAGGGNLDERAAEIAQHWADAAEPARAARWYGRAAEWAGHSNMRQALDHWRRVRELAPAIDMAAERDALTSRAVNQILNFGWHVGGTDEEEMASVFAEGRALAERTGDRRALALLLGNYGLTRASLAGSFTDYLRYGEEAVQISEHINDIGLRAATRTWPAWANAHMGMARATLTCAERVLNEVGADNRLGMEHIGYSPRAGSLLNRAMAYVYLGQLDDAEHEFNEALRGAEAAADLAMYYWTLPSLALLGKTRGADPTVLEFARRAVEQAETQDNDEWRIYAGSALATGYLLNGMFPEARNALQEIVGIINDLRFGLNLLASFFSLLSEAHRELGEFAEAVSAAQEGVRHGETAGTRYSEACASIALATALTASDASLAEGEIESALKRAEFLVEITEGHSLTPQILEARARLMARLGDAAASTRLLHEALGKYRDIGATGHAGRLARELTP